MRVVENLDYIKVLPNTEYADKTTLYDPSRLQSGSINIVYKVDISGLKTVVATNIKVHSDDADTYEVHNLLDGLYEIVNLTVPTRCALELLGMTDGFSDKEYQREWQMLNPKNLLRPETTIIVAMDEESPTYFSFLTSKRINGESHYFWIPIDDLLDLFDELDGRDIDCDVFYGTNIRVSTGLYLRYLDLQAKLQLKTLELFSKYSNTLCNSNECSTITKLDTMVRDYLWMTVNAIKYAFDTCDAMTALKLLNCTQSCSNGKMYESSLCGCSQTRR